MLHQNASSPNLLGHEGRARPISLPESFMTSMVATDPKQQELVARDEFLQKSKAGACSSSRHLTCCCVVIFTYFFICAVHGTLKHLYRTIMTERERLKQALTTDDALVPANVANYVASLKASFTEVRWNDGILSHSVI